VRQFRLGGLRRKEPAPRNGMTMEWIDYLKAFVALFAITDPIGTIPLFLTLTRDQTPEQRLRTIRMMIIVAAGVFLAAVFVGQALLNFFGIGIPAFRIAGGLLLLVIAFDMLNARPTRTKRTPEEAAEAEASDPDSIAVTPLAIPMIAGPGSVSALIMYSNQSDGIPHQLSLAAIAILLAAVSFVIFRAAVPLGRLLGTTGTNIIARLMGLVLAAIGVEFVLSGVVDYFGW
jgi:multiple antibiotic resistance protein